MLFSFIYNFSLVILSLLSAPKLLYHYFFLHKYHESLPQKLGLNLPKIEKKGRFLIWVHAVSVGETKAVSSLVRSLKKKYNNCLIVISSTTETGHAEAKRSIACADYHLYLPFDFSWVIKPYIKRVSPDLVLLCESDFWYHFLQASKDAGAKIALVNGKISSKSTKRFSYLPFVSKKIFSLFDLACLQSDHYRSRFIQCGMPEEIIVVTGNLKLDDDYPVVEEEELNNWKKELGIDKENSVVVVGSTHAPEEDLILKSLHPLWKLEPTLKVVLVPRHPERFDEVAKLLEEKQIPFNRLGTPKAKNGDEKVVLIDAMGLLRRCYQLADVAVVAGSYTSKVGGHNITEPCSYGVPTLFGPHMQNQPELVKLVNKFGAGLQVEIDDLPTVIQSLLKDKNKKDCLGKAGLKLFQNSKGATMKTCHQIEELTKTSQR